jgi:predicted transporter
VIFSIAKVQKKTPKVELSRSTSGVYSLQRWSLGKKRLKKAQKMGIPYEIPVCMRAYVSVMVLAFLRLSRS